MQNKLIPIKVEESVEGETVKWQNKFGEWCRGIVIAENRVLPDLKKDYNSNRKDGCLFYYDAKFYKD